MSYSFLQTRLDESIAEIRLNRPERRNALTYEMIAELTTALQEAASGRARGIILKASGSVFCAGHDYHDMLARDLSGMRDLMQTCSHMMQLIHRLPLPVVASVQGPAIGAGCQLALSCDLVVASAAAMFRTPGGTRGWFCLTPMVAVSRVLGCKRALEMLLTGEPVTAEQALSWGMVNRVVPPNELAESTRDLMTRVTRGSQAMIGIGKNAFYNQVALDEASAYAYAAELMAATGMMPDAQARMKAFVEKRPRAPKSPAVATP